MALPLCLGIALASNAPLFSGIVAGVVGGLVVGALSGSHTSVAGPAAGLTAIVAVQIERLGSFEAFLLAVVLGGVLQLGLGLVRAGSIAAFFPSSVIKGLLAAIGLLLILKQVPHVLGHDPDPVGEMAFEQPDQRTTFSELLETVFDVQPGAALVGALSILLLVGWDRVPKLKGSRVPAPLLVVVGGVLVNELFLRLGSGWAIGAEHLVRVPVSQGLADAASLVRLPDFSALANPAVYLGAATIAIVASLETLLNLEAVDKLDTLQRKSPPNRELVAQGVGNMVAGLVGGLPVTSVVVRGSVNVASGAKTRVSTLFHGGLLLSSVLLVPGLLNLIPLSALAAILIVTGFKLASPKLVRQMWSEGRNQFVPFVVTVVAIVTTDLLVGILIGLVASTGFILHSNLRRPLRRIVERHLGGDVLRIELANQVSFLNRAALEEALLSVPRGGHVLVDARNTNYIDADVVDLLRDFREKAAPARGVELSLLGFKDHYSFSRDTIQYVDFTTREIQSALTPRAVLQVLLEGNERFRAGQQLTRDLMRQASRTAGSQAPLAVVLSCIDSRAPTELIFDVGIGDVFSIRIAGNVARNKVLASMEYACVVAGAKLVVVMGHTSCGAVTSTLDLARKAQTAEEATGCQHIDYLVEEIRRGVDADTLEEARQASSLTTQLVDEAAARNVRRTMRSVLEKSDSLRNLVGEGSVAVIGAMYDVATGTVRVIATEGLELAKVEPALEGPPVLGAPAADAPTSSPDASP